MKTDHPAVGDMYYRCFTPDDQIVLVTMFNQNTDTGTVIIYGDGISGLYPITRMISYFDELKRCGWEHTT